MLLSWEDFKNKKVSATMVYLFMGMSLASTTFLPVEPWLLNGAMGIFVLLCLASKKIEEKGILGRADTLIIASLIVVFLPSYPVMLLVTLMIATICFLIYLAYVRKVLKKPDEQIFFIPFIAFGYLMALTSILI